MPLRPDQIPDLGSAPAASDIILRSVRGAIISGALAEGEPIRQDDVARLFNVSKIPVREALKSLEAEGLVIFQRNKGAVVTTVSGPEIVQIFEVRAILEASAMRFSVPRMTGATLDRAEEFRAAFEKEADVSKWAELNWRFHSCLYEDADRPFLLNMIRSMNDRVERYLRMQLSLSGGRTKADQEHRDILEACRKQDAEAAAAQTYRHIMDACTSLLLHRPGHPAVAP